MTRRASCFLQWLGPPRSPCRAGAPRRTPWDYRLRGQGFSCRRLCGQAEGKFPQLVTPRAFLTWTRAFMLSSRLQASESHRPCGFKPQSHGQKFLIQSTSRVRKGSTGRSASCSALTLKCWSFQIWALCTRLSHGDSGWP